MEMILVICSACDSKGYIIKDGKSITCEVCNGKGYIKRVVDTTRNKKNK